MRGLLITLALVSAMLVLAPLATADDGAVTTSTQQRSFREYLFGSRPLGWADLDWELDLYYTNLSLNIPLAGTPIQDLSGMGEPEIYSRLLVNSLVPRFLLLEVAVMPLPLTGVALQEYASGFYRSGELGGGQNLFQWITAGFEEPYAVSLFLGDMVRFSKQGEERLSSNKGYMGYLCSYSNQHIKNNVLIPDDSVEVEWKLKGERSFREEKLAWSFRMGAKMHDHPDIADTFYLGFRRSDLDFTVNPIAFLKNSAFEVRWDISTKTGALLRQEYILGKKFPIKSWGVAFKLDGGMIWEASERYRGSLKDHDASNVTVVLRPNIIF